MEIKWPTWQRDNALAKLREVRDRTARMEEEAEDPLTKKACESQRLSMNLAISVVESMIQLEDPHLPSIKLVLRNAAGEFIEDIGRAIENFGASIQDINKWGWRRDPYD